VPSNESLAQSIASLPPAERAAQLRQLAPTPAEAAALERCWRFWARPKQLAPEGAWQTWLVLAGRGFGKTRTGAEWIRQRVESRQAQRIALVARTAADVRDVIIGGESGLLAIFPKRQRPVWQPSKRLLTFHTGAIATTFSADEPDSLRGPQHDTAWCDELASWFYPDAWDQLLFGLRLGDDPRVIVTTTPRPTPIIKALVADPTTRVTTGSTYENAGNLAPSFLSKIVRKYEGTALGAQELHAQILGDTQGALWTRGLIEKHRRSPVGLPGVKRLAVAVDPSVSEEGDGDEAGIVAGFLGEDDHAYILEDATLQGSPDAWGRRSVKAYHDHHADRLLAEVNNGGALVEALIKTIDKTVAYKAVHAAQGKRTRAEPVSALYEQGRVHHVGMFGKLEDQLCTWVPSSGAKSPGRLDALVWLVTDLMLGPQVEGGLFSGRIRRR
jgi:phage terminase large subunit-like protein